MNRSFSATLCIGVAAALLSSCGGQATSNAMPPSSSVQTAIGGSSPSFRILLRFGQTHSSSSPLLNVNGDLYGTTADTSKCGHHRCPGNGTVFRISPKGARKVIYYFKGGASDGAGPAGPLIDVNGTLYGTTVRGGGMGCGSQGCGTVYSLTTSGSEKMLYAFKGGYDGQNPFTGVVNVNGTLYGVTPEGGGYTNCQGQPTGCGTFYSVRASGSEMVLYRFVDMSNGWVPDSPLLNVNGTLYGATLSGGMKCGRRTDYYGLGCGVVYSISTSGSEAVLHTFDDSSLRADIPFGGLLNVRGTLYGVTFSARGAAYRMGINGDKFKVIHLFEGSPDGSRPIGPFINVNGLLYGATTGGGANNLGTIYSMTTGGKVSVVYSFSGLTGGAFPYQSPTELQGTLYGTTSAGGRRQCYDGCGTVYSLTL